jgi:hypothetical protein
MDDSFSAAFERICRRCFFLQDLRRRSIPPTVCKDALISIKDMQHSLPPVVANILQEYSDVFPSEILEGLPPIRGIKHQIDLIPGASLSNHAPYRTNPEETKEIQRQVQELLDKGYITLPCVKHMH